MVASSCKWRLPLRAVKKEMDKNSFKEEIYSKYLEALLNRIRGLGSCSASQVLLYFRWSFAVNAQLMTD